MSVIFSTLGAGQESVEVSDDAHYLGHGQV